VIESVIDDLCSFETLRPIRMWYLRMLMVSLLFFAFMFFINAAQCWIIAHLWTGNNVELILQIMLTGFVIITFTSRSIRYLLSLVSQVSIVLQAQAEDTLVTLFDNPVVLRFAHDAITIALDEFAKSLGAFSLPLRGVLQLVNAVGGVDQALTILRRRWPKHLRSLLDGDHDKDEAKERTVEETIALLGAGTAVTDAGQGVQEVAAAMAMQRVFRGQKGRRLLDARLHAERPCVLGVPLSPLLDGVMRQPNDMLTAVQSTTHPISERLRRLRCSNPVAAEEAAATGIQARVRGLISRRRGCTRSSLISAPPPQPSDPRDQEMAVGEASPMERIRRSLAVCLGPPQGLPVLPVHLPSRSQSQISGTLLLDPSQRLQDPNARHRMIWGL